MRQSTTRPLALFALLILAGACAIASSQAHAEGPSTSAAKTRWHGLDEANANGSARDYFVGTNDRFRAYDVRGHKTGQVGYGPISDFLGITDVWPPSFDPGYPYETDLNYSANGCPGHSYCAWRATRKQADAEYAKAVDWPVTMIFVNNASIGRVKAGFENQKLNSDKGGPMYMSVADSPEATGGWYGQCVGASESHACDDSHGQLWDKDQGLKEVACSTDKSFTPPIAAASGNVLDYTHHIRLYGDERGGTPGTSNDRLYNPKFGFYVLGTTHIDLHECTTGPKFGWSEYAESYIGRLAYKEWQRIYATPPGYENRPFNSWWWLNNREGYSWYTPGNTRTEVGRSLIERIGNWRDWEPGKPYPEAVHPRVQDDHVWLNDGWAREIWVGPRRPEQNQGRIASPGDDEAIGGPEEPEPELEPAIDGDVDGDDKADLVTLNTSGTAYTYKGSDGSSKSTPFGGGMNSALFDGAEHHVIDVADVDADGYSDLVTLSFNSALGINNVVCVFPGQSDGSFGAGILARGGITPGTFGPGGHEPIGVADVTGDKRADLVTFYAPQGNLYVYPGLENGQFGDGMTQGGGQVNSALFDRSGSYFLDVADVNGDGHADVTAMFAQGPWSSYGKLLTYTGWSGGLRVGPDTGITLDPIMNDGTGHEPLGMGDVNEDGRADLVTLKPGGSFSVYQGTQQTSSYGFTYASFESTPVNSGAEQKSSLMGGSGDDFVGLMDRTGDGQADLVKVQPDGTVLVAPGQSNLQFGSFSSWATGVTSNRFNAPSSYEMLQEKPFLRRLGCTSAGCIGRPQPPESDVDGDRRSDLVTLDSVGTSHTYRAMGEGEHATSFVGGMDSALYDGKGHHVIDVADVNGDWRADKVTLSNGTVYVHPGRTDGTFGPGVGSFSGAMAPGPHDPEGFEPIGVADVTGDGFGDLAVFREGVGVKVYPGAANSTFGTGTVSQSGLHTALFGNNGSAGVHFLDVADVTGDRLADLITTGSGVSVYKGNSSGEFTFADFSGMGWAMDDGSGAQPVGISDVNGDSRADLVTWDSGTVKVYAGLASGDFQTYDHVGPSPSGTSFDGSLDSNLIDGTGDEIAGLFDENGDRRADLVTVKDNGIIQVYSGKQDFTFSATPKARVLPDLTPGRFNRLPGHEIVSEKPFLMRPGCAAKGCFWPPWSVEGDINGDRRADVVSMHSNGDVQVFTGSSGGISGSPFASLSKQVDSALFDGTGEYGVDVADVTGDGLSDLVTLGADGSVEIRSGQDDRTFSAPIDSEFSLPPSLRAEEGFEPIGVADVNGDRRGDLVGFHETKSSQFLATYAGQDDGRFVDPETETAYSQEGAVNSALKDGTGEYFLDVVDVDGDERGDLVSMSTSGSVRVYRGQADGRFDAAVTAASVDPVMDNGSGQEPVGLGDVNGDGRADLLTLDGSLKLFTGKADGTFASPTNPYTGSPWEPSSMNSSLMDGEGQEFIGLMDYSRDGRADLITAWVTAGGSTTAFKAYKGKADGTLALPSVTAATVPQNRFNNMPGNQFVNENPFLLRAGCRTNGCEWPQINEVESDVDGDGRSDFVTVHTDGSAYVFSGRKSGGLELSSPTISLNGQLDPALFDGAGDYMVDVADVNFDGRGDLVTQDDDEDVHVYPGRADRTFGAGMEAYSFEGALDDLEPIAAADVTGDHYADLVYFGVAGGEGRALVAPGSADGTFSEEDAEISLKGSINSALFDRSGEYFLDVADLTGDGMADLVSMSTSGSARVYKGQADAKFGSAVTAASINPAMDDGSGVEPVGIGDVNKDGRADLVTASSTGSVSIYTASSSGTLTEAATGHIFDSSLTDKTGDDLIGLLDYNGDGRSDLVVADSQAGVSQFQGYSNSTTMGLSYTGPPAGFVRSNRFGKPNAHQMVTEKPFVRRAGCASTGCEWPPEPPAPPAQWSREQVGQSQSEYNDVVCETYFGCVAVGYSQSDSGDRSALISYWEGSGTWTKSEPLDDPESESEELSGLSCVNDECVAVGSRQVEGETSSLILMDDGSSTWSSAEVPAPAGAQETALASVSCVNGSLCMAVGSYVDGDGDRRAMSLGWDGTEWTLVSTPGEELEAPPNYYAAASSELTGVSCPTETMCAAVGTYVDRQTEVRSALSLSWDGSAWSLVETPGMGGETPRELSGIACPQATSCVAVGSYTEANNLRRTWSVVGDGSSWSSVTTPVAVSVGGLSDVSCPSESLCTAAGSAKLSGKTRPIVTEWDGSSWEGNVLELPGEAASAELNGISCLEAECQATGKVSYDGTKHLGAGYAFDGSSGWATESGGSGASMRALSCVTTEECVAVGDSDLAPGEQDSAASWILDGEWGLTASAEVSSPSFADVSCTALDACTGVGSWASSWPSPPLAERWDGDAWSAQTTPTASGTGSYSAKGVSCYEANGCIAVGWYPKGSGSAPWAQKWNGSSWSTMSVPLPSGSPTTTALQDVACTSSTNCYAVGNSSASGNRALVEHWNGSSWTVVTVPVPSGTTFAGLRAISCTSASACTAVGHYTAPSNPNSPLIIRWNGSSWALQSASMPPGTTLDEFNDVSCFAATGCLAVGSYALSSGATGPLAIEWDGTLWTVESVPSAPGSPWLQVLESAYCKAVDDCLAVGYTRYENAAEHHEPLVLRKES